MSYQLITVGTCAAGMALVGLVYNATAVHLMLGALVAVLVVSYASSRLSALALEWRREAADRVFEHEPLTISAELTNRSRLPRFLLTVVDRLPEHLRSDQPPEFVLPALWPGERVRFSYQARGLKRGVYRLGPLRVSVSDPFGIFQRFVPLQAVGEAVIYPRPVALLTPFELGESAGDPGQSAGERVQPSDSGMEFYGVRDYQPGDELRRIHWPATARHGQFTVIEFEHATSRSLVVVLDARAGTEFGTGADTSLEVGVRVAASLVHWALESEGQAVLAVECEGGPRWVEIAQPDDEYAAFEVLARVQAEGTIAISRLLGWAGRQLPPGGVICLVTAAPDRELAGAVAVLRAQHTRVAAVLLDAFSFDPRAARMTSAEALEAAGAVTTIVRRGDNLQEALKGALVVAR